MPSAVKYGQVKWSWLRAQALWLCGHILPGLIFVAVSLSLPPSLWHCFTLFFYLCLGFTSCLLCSPTPSHSLLPRALFNFKFHLLRTVCLSFPIFLFSFLVYLFSYLINLCLGVCVSICVCACVFVPSPWPFGFCLCQKTVRCGSFILKLSSGRIQFKFYFQYTVLHNYICQKKNSYTKQLVIYIHYIHTNFERATA